MRNQLRFSKMRIVRDCAILFVLSAVAMLMLEHTLKGISGTLLLLPFLGIFLVYYIFSTRASLSQKLAMFTAICALMSIASEIAYVVYGINAEHGAINDNNLTVNSLQLGFILLTAIAMYKPLKSNGAYLIDNLRIDWIWISTIPVSVIIFANLGLSVPMFFETRDDPDIVGRMLAQVLLASGLYLFQVIVFAHMCKVLMSEDQIKRRKRVSRCSASSTR